MWLLMGVVGENGGTVCCAAIFEEEAYVMVAGFRQHKNTTVAEI